MVNDSDNNFDDIDINELFNDFNENPSQLLPKYNFDDVDINEFFNDFYENRPQLLPKNNFKTKKNQDDDLTEFNEKDCTAPRIYRKRTKPKKKTNTKQTTMYDYASSISYKNRHFYSSWDNKTTTKIITKEPKRPLHEQSSSTAKTSKTVIDEDLSPKLAPDFIDNLINYFDKRTQNKTNPSK